MLKLFSRVINEPSPWQLCYKFFVKVLFPRSTMNPPYYHYIVASTGPYSFAVPPLPHLNDKLTANSLTFIHDFSIYGVNPKWLRTSLLKCCQRGSLLCFALTKRTIICWEQQGMQQIRMRVKGIQGRACCTSILWNEVGMTITDHI